ncbi:MAG: tyrosine-protein phosphatase [Sulfurovum sp.]|nr:tyrosine-protein phosphatase [Sulfurovum sp.]MCB4744818.1 tyrosine-protein phosphatase [Sulfurovum sp.]MCB4746034.1 tyrosine-protein phosphatase [Sulfurovum sp.]MCB4747540.1 tyrosine-protein phosphatase [Sulfurovum sp.]MCB4749454.1 tyrosine-protein phosphatase [Sulfurovum sp.]
MRQNIRYILKYIITPLFSLILLWFSYLYIYGNIHQVNRDLYRSAQLYQFNMPYYFTKYHIRTVINLRGSAPQKQWYQNEIRFCKEHNITHIDFGISDRKVVDISTMHHLVSLMQKAKKPLLVHCKAGADRTSLASALYRYAIEHDIGAYKQISFKYGHFPYLGSPTVAMDKSFNIYIQHFPLKETDVSSKIR